MTPEETSRRIAFLHTTFRTQRIFEVEFVLPEIWDRPSMITGAGVHYHMGFTPPYLHPHRGYLVIMCAEVLVQRSAELTTAEFFACVGALEVHLDLHVIETDAGTRDDEVEDRVLAMQPNIALDFTLYDRIATREPWRNR